jgi:large subunit ribosomal protein L35
MPKMKTHKGAAKRFGVTGSGKVVRVKAWKGHHLDIKPSSRTRRYAGKAIVDGTSSEQIKGLLPYIKKLG